MQLLVPVTAVAIALLAQLGATSSSVTPARGSGTSAPASAMGGSGPSSPVTAPPVTAPPVTAPLVTAPLVTAPLVTAPRPVRPVTRWGAGTAGPDPRQVAPGPGFNWPLSPRPAVIRRFEQPSSQWSPGHRGVDLLATVGQQVLSAGDGVVAFSGVIAGRGVVSVRHAGGLRTTYEPVDQRPAPGARVHRGDRIGVLSPMPGHCPPHTCLHWGAIWAQTYRDPLSLLGFGRPILLPLG